MFAVAAALAVALVTPSAQTARVDALVAQMRVPVVQATQVILAPCPEPTDTNDAGCTYPETGSPVWISPAQFTPFSLYHELGHRYRFDALSDGAEHRFVTIMRYRRWGPAIEERFADAYASCALGWKPHVADSPGDTDPRFPTGYSYWPTPSQQRQVCGMITRSAPA